MPESQCPAIPGAAVSYTASCFASSGKTNGRGREGMQVEAGDDPVRTRRGFAQGIRTARKKAHRWIQTFIVDSYRRTIPFSLFKETQASSYPVYLVDD